MTTSDALFSLDDECNEFERQHPRLAAGPGSGGGGGAGTGGSGGGRSSDGNNSGSRGRGGRSSDGNNSGGRGGVNTSGGRSSDGNNSGGRGSSGGAGGSTGPLGSGVGNQSFAQRLFNLDDAESGRRSSSLDRCSNGQF